MKPKILAFITYPVYTITVLFAIYFLLVFLLPPGGYFGGDQGVKFSQINSLAHSRGLVVGTTKDVLSTSRPAFSKFYVQVVENYEAWYSPAYAIVVLPFYLLMGVRGLVLPSVLGILLAAYSSGLLGKELGMRYPGAIVLIVGLTSPLIFYAFILWEHAISVGLIVLATYFFMKNRFIAAGVLAALSIWFRPETMLFEPALITAVLVTFGIRASTGKLLRFLVGFIIGIIPWWLFNFLNFGTPLGPQVAQNPLTVENRLGVISLHLLPLGLKRWAILLVVVLVLLAILYLLRRSSLPALLLLLFGIVGINISNLSLYLSGTAPSFTDVFPFAFATLISIIWLGKDIKYKLIFVLTVSYLFGVTLITPSWGGGGWGPRMLLCVFPFLAILGWKGFEICKDYLLKVACLSLLISSLFIQMAGLRYLSSIQNQYIRLNSELTALQPNVVATAVWWLPHIGASTHEQIRWYGVKDVGDIEKLVSFEKCFWWIWTGEPSSDWQEFTLHHVSTLPVANLSTFEVRKLSTRGLEAIKYCVVR